ncbi:hypothetical protein LCGC14_2675230 [marine sediment metagenome]|uniref:Uncharacterized protein n=1 Tax=marine sediment metagenome TaxID=412755 RepID=A0A0F9AAG7_9ZZZZ
MKKPRKHPKFHSTKKVKKKPRKARTCEMAVIQRFNEYDYVLTEKGERMARYYEMEEPACKYPYMQRLYSLFFFKSKSGIKKHTVGLL